MFPYLIAGAIGYAVAKIFKDEAPKYADGGLIVGEYDGDNKFPTKEEAFELIQDSIESQGTYFIDEEGDGMFESEEQAQRYVDEVYDVLDTFYSMEMIPVYRVVEADEVDLDPYGIGESWSMYLDSAKNFGNHLGVSSKQLKIISGYVPNNNVDWESAFRLYVVFSDLGNGDSEFELPIPSNNKIFDVRVSDFKEAKELEPYKFADGGQTPPYVSDDFQIGYDGAYENLIAPNGKPSNLTPEQYKLVRTPAFKEWFGDWENDPTNASKVVDSNGEPMAVYHGTTMGDFNNFKSYINFFAKDKNIAKNQYSTINSQGQFTNRSKVYEVFLNLRNPYKFDAKNKDYSELRHKFKGEVYDVLDDLSKEIKDNYNTKYDGLIILNIDEEQMFGTFGKKAITDDFVSFEPNQIKLADGSNTTFDSNNPDIRYAGGGGVEEISWKDKSIKSYLEAEGFKILKDGVVKYGDVEFILWMQRKYIINRGEKYMVEIGTPTEPNDSDDYGLKIAVLDNIKNLGELNKGQGSFVLNKIIEASDKTGTILQLFPQQQGSKGLTTNKLKDWYTKRGFVVVNDENVMERKPAETEKISNNPDIRYAGGGKVKKVKFDIDDDEDGDRTEISIKGIGKVILAVTYPEYEFLEDIGEDGLEELGVEEGDMIGKIEHLEIEDKYKGQGYAKLLMNKAIEVAKEKGLMPLYLNASPMGSKRYGLDLDDLTGFYESLGFEVFLEQGNNNLMILKDSNNTDNKYEDGGLVDDIFTLNTYIVETGDDSYSHEEYSGNDYDEALSIYNGITPNDFVRPNSSYNYKNLIKDSIQYKFIGELEEGYEISDYTDDINNEDYWENIDYDYELLLGDKIEAINEVTDEYIDEIQSFINNEYVNDKYTSSYMDIDVYADEEKENYLDKITIRVKDHSQNPANKKGRYNLSFVIADANDTKHRWRSRDEYYFDSSDDIEDIKSEIITIIEEKIQEVKDDYE